MKYSDELVEEIRSKNDIVDVISSYVRLTKKGSNYFGLCPFHNEKTGSFSVTPSKQMYYCFGCHAGGNVISFIKEYENYSFAEAIKFLADRVGVELPNDYSEEDRARESKRQLLLEINKEAGKYYYAQLRSESGRKGYEYLSKRGLDDETMKRFGLGYARSSQNETYRYLKSKGFEDSLLLESGLFNHSEQYGIRDKFWNRVIFPIMDTNNRIIGFGGRVMGDGEPKYLNSPETIVFDKGRNLYGLNQAKSARCGYFILVEGYMDVISLHRAGFNQAVASLGTAFTVGQAHLLKRYTENVYLCYDSDYAGTDASLRALPMLHAVGITAKVINMRPYKDSDEFIKNLGADEFRKRIDEAENGFYFEIRVLSEKYDIKDPADKTKFLNEVAKRILRFEDPIERENYSKGISSKYNISVESFDKVVARHAASGVKGISVDIGPIKSGVKKKLTKEDGIKRTQGMLLNWLCEQPRLYPQVKRHVSVSDFSDPLFGQVAKILFEQLEKDELNPAFIISCFNEEEEQRQVAQLFHTGIDYLETISEKERAIKDLIIAIKKNSLEIKAMSDSDEMDPLAAAIAEKKQMDELSRIRIDMTDIS